MDRLHAKGFISNPKCRQKSMALTETGSARTEQLFRQMFAPTLSADVE